MPSLDFQGLPEFRRDRHLTNSVRTQAALDNQPVPNPEDTALVERVESVDGLFSKLATTYLKGKVIQEALSKMEPDQWIPIEPGATTVVAAARRRNPRESADGTRITFRMFQGCIDQLLQRTARLSALLQSTDGIPTTVETAHKVISNRGGGKDLDLLTDFAAGNGIVGTLLAFYTIMPVFNSLFQTLTPVESAAKANAAATGVSGIALLLAIGVQAEEIINVFSKQPAMNSLLADIERLKGDDVAQDEALRTINVDGAQIRANLGEQDAETLIQYTRDYCARHGGVFPDFDHLTMDHWHAYASAAHANALIEQALQTAPAYSPKFQAMMDSQEPKKLTLSAARQVMPMSTTFASSIDELDHRMENTFNDMANVFLYQIDDQVLCCLISIVGELDTDILYRMSHVLRILAMDLNGILIGFQDRLRARIGDLLTGLLFRYMDMINQFMGEAVQGLTKMARIPGTEQCPGLLMLLNAILQVPFKLKAKLNEFVAELMSRIADFSQSHTGAWALSADRRALLSMAKMLEALALRLGDINVCANEDDKVHSPSEVFQRAADQVTHTFLEHSPPSLQISDADLQKYFSGIPATKSPNLPVSYRMGATQVSGADSSSSSTAQTSDCSSPVMKEHIDLLRQAVVDALRS